MLEKNIIDKRKIIRFDNVSCWTNLNTFFAFGGQKFKISPRAPTEPGPALVLTMCNLTLSNILQKPNKTRSACLHYVMKFSGLNSARAHLECVLSLHDSV